MFEKEAEDSFKCKKVLYKWETDKHSYIDGFKDGVKFGYNKCKEVEDKVFYIVGKITGDKNYKTKFYNAYKFLTEKKGYSKVISPTCTPDNLPYECYAPISIGFVQACDCLFVLRDWKESKGARAEVAYAEMLGKEIFYEEMIPNLEIKGE